MKLLDTGTSTFDENPQLPALSQASLPEHAEQPRIQRIVSNIGKTFAFLIYTSIAKPDFSREKYQETNTVLLFEAILGRRKLTPLEARRMALDVLEMAEKRRENFIEEEARRAISI